MQRDFALVTNVEPNFALHPPRRSDQFRVDQGRDGAEYERDGGRTRSRGDGEFERFGQFVAHANATPRLAVDASERTVGDFSRSARRCAVETKRHQRQSNGLDGVFRGGISTTRQRKTSALITGASVVLSPLEPQLVRVVA